LKKPFEVSSIQQGYDDVKAGRTPTSSSAIYVASMTFRVEISAQAERDAESILEWLLAEHAGRAGMDWFLALDDAFASLAEFPERCPVAPESARFPFEVRQLLYGRKPHLYRILFTIEADTVHVLHIRHGRRKAVVPSE